MHLPKSRGAQSGIFTHDPKPMNRIAFLPLLFASIPLYSAPQGMLDSAGSGAEVSIKSEFAVEIEYPNFVISVLAHLTGAHFERLTLEERDSAAFPFGSFLYHLNEGDNRWLELSSDSAFPSFVTLPRTDRTVIRPGALSFVKELLLLFQSPRRDTVRGEFEYAGDTLGARGFQKYSSIDSGSRVTTYSRVETWNRDTGEEYINGDVQAVTQEGITTYQDIRISLKNKNVNMHFTPIHIDVARSGGRGIPGEASVQNTFRRPD